MPKITDALLKSLDLPGNDPETFWDTELEDFGVILVPDGIGYIVRSSTKNSDKEKYIPIGRYKEIPLPQARGKAKNIIEQIAKGINPSLIKLNNAGVNGLDLPMQGEYFVWDSEIKGFGIKLTPTSMSYIAQGRVNGKSKRATIGKHGVFTPKQARDKAKQLLMDMANGIDPVQVKRKEQASSQTLVQVAEQYKANKRTKEGYTLKESTKSDIDRHLNESFSDWTDKPLSALTRDMIHKRYVDLSKKSVARANQGFRVLRAIFNWERKRTRRDSGEFILLSNPVEILTDLDLWGNVPTRNSKIPVEKMGLAWHFLTTRRNNPALSKLAVTSADMVIFLMLTGTRRQEARSLTWNQVDLEDGSVHLPDTKNHNPITIPMSKQLAHILKSRPMDSEYVFPSHSKKGYIRDVRDCLKLLSKEVGGNITAHDLRRTFKAVGQKNNVEDFRLRLLMNHKLNKSDASFSSYTEKSDVRYLRDDTQKISDWIEAEGVKAAHRVVDLESRRKVA